MQTKFYWKYFTSLLKSYQLETNHYSLHEKYIHLFFLENQVTHYSPIAENRNTQI
jgi:hypothetical protein